MFKYLLKGQVMKRLFSYVACILFVHQASASELTLEQFRETLGNRHTFEYLTQKVLEHITKFEPELAKKSQEGLECFDYKTIFNLIKKTRNETLVATSLMFCSLLTTIEESGEPTNKGEQLFQEILQEAKMKGKDIYSFDTGKVSNNFFYYAL